MPSKTNNKDSLPVLYNSKARHKYALGDKYEAGLVLSGTEVKSIRGGNAQLSESFAKFIKDELFLCNAHIAGTSSAGRESSPTKASQAPS